MAANRSKFSKHLMTGSSIFSVNLTNRKNLAKPSYPAKRKWRFPSWAGAEKKNTAGSHFDKKGNFVATGPARTLPDRNDQS